MSTDVTPHHMDSYDVAVVGAGSGGLATAIFLARSGMQVACIDPNPFPHQYVGESLDWSAPELLRQLGLNPAQLVASKAATVKGSIRIEPPDSPAWYARPPKWLGRRPFGIELTTLHVDRKAVDQALYELACRLNVKFIQDRIIAIVTENDLVRSVQSSGGRRIGAKWFVDASGRARLFAKHLDIQRTTFGPQKVCLWAYFNSSPHNNGTTFFPNSAHDTYLTWLWDIPINPTTTSVGCIMSADRLNHLRHAGMGVDEILRQEMAPHTRFAPLLEHNEAIKVSTCSYQTYVNDRAAGPNWFAVGEASSMPDPFTGNGVTAAYRQAREASQAIIDCRQAESTTTRQQRAYTANVQRMGRILNHGIESIIYDYPVRVGLGLRAAQTAYATPAWLSNMLYSKLIRRGKPTMHLFSLWLIIAHLWIGAWNLAGKLVCRCRSLSFDATTTQSTESSTRGPNRPLRSPNPTRREAMQQNSDA